MLDKPNLCKSGVHCTRCRDVKLGAIKREGMRGRLVALAVLPAEAPADFDCPFGVAWGEQVATAPVPPLKLRCPRCGGEHLAKNCMGVIPDDYDPEKERRRMLQGGCCH